MNQAAKKTVFLFVGILLPLIAFPETSPNSASLRSNPKTLAYLTDSSVDKKLVDIGKMWDKQLGVVCDSPVKVEYSADRIFIHKPVELPDGAQHPVDGIWQYRFDLVRCGHSTTYNTLVVSQKGAVPRDVPILPGKTIASPTLQMDTLQIVRSKVTMEAKVNKNSQCEDFVVSDTSLVSVPQQAKDGGAGGRWEERWMARYCNETVPIPVCFNPNAKGTAILTQSCAEAR